MSRLYMRTGAEAHLYMNQQPCTCGDIEFDRRSAVMIDGGMLCSRYFGKCRTCGTLREFLFELPPTQRPVTNEVEFGGSDPSRLLDAGEWLAIAEHHARREPGTPGDLDIARAAMEEVLKFVPDGAERVPDTAFWTERGRAVRDREPGRFRRARLAAILDAYREQLARDDLRAMASREGSASTVVPGAEAIKRAFDGYFVRHRMMALPEEALRHAAGEFSDNGWDVRYRFGEEQGIVTLDVFAEHRRTNDRLYRVYADGRVDIVGSSTEGMDEGEDRAFYAEVRRRLGS